MSYVSRMVIQHVHIKVTATDVYISIYYKMNKGLGLDKGVYISERL